MVTLTKENGFLLSRHLHMFRETTRKSIESCLFEKKRAVHRKGMPGLKLGGRPKISRGDTWGSEGEVYPPSTALTFRPIACNEINADGSTGIRNQL